jgi:CAAX prenyl protease-like protein
LLLVAIYGRIKLLRQNFYAEANFESRFSAAAGQQVYAFVWGIIYAYWLEKSGSLLPSIIGHNLGNLLEDILAFVMVSRWS